MKNKLTGKYYANGGAKLDEFSIQKPVQVIGYSYGLAYLYLEIRKLNNIFSNSGYRLQYENRQGKDISCKYKW
jgi:hypothetical protein